MFDFIINTLGALGAVILIWSMVRAYSRQTQKDSKADPNEIEDYLQKITRIAGISVYETFRISAEEWRVSDDRIEQDFERYLSSQSIPFYVKDFVRRGQKHIDEAYRGKDGFFSDKRLLLFYLCLTLFFWGMSVILSLYVIPYLMPFDVRSAY